MIVGFDYQNQEVVAQELDGLMQLKPALAQFLIYGPVPGTPFHERIIKDNLLQDVYTDDKDLFYRRADGFRTMIKHPTLSAEEIEAIQEWCFKEDFQRLGPSIYRVLEARLLGYAENEELAQPAACAPRRSITPANCAMPTRSSWPGVCSAPTRRCGGGLAIWSAQVHAELGAPASGQRLKSVLGVAAAVWTGLTLKLDLFQHPKLIRNTYRVPSRRWDAFEMWEEFRHKNVSPGLLRAGRVAPLHQGSLDTPGRRPLALRCREAGRPHPEFAGPLQEQAGAGLQKGAVGQDAKPRSAA